MRHIKVPPDRCPSLLQLLTDRQNSFTITFRISKTEKATVD